jgi:hypothetical protein
MMSKGKAVFRPPEPSNYGQLPQGKAILATHWFPRRNNDKLIAKSPLKM